MRRIKISYEIVTPESAAEGDAAERGWEDEEGVSIEPDQYDLEDAENELEAVVQVSLKTILDHGGVEPSGSLYSRHTWYTTTDAEIDWQDGSHKTYSFHLKGFSEEEERAIYERIASN